MRMAFGLVALLVAIGVVVLIMAFAELPYNQAVVKSGKSAQKTALQLSGRDAQGTRVQDSIALLPQTSNNRVDAMLVTGLIPNGPMAAKFGLKIGDRIIETGEQGGDGVQTVRISEVSLGDVEMAKAKIYEAYIFDQPLVVMRDGQRLHLPQPGGAPAAAPAAQGQATGGNGGAGQQNLPALPEGIPTH